MGRSGVVRAVVGRAVVAVERGWIVLAGNWRERVEGCGVEKWGGAGCEIDGVLLRRRRMPKG